MLFSRSLPLLLGTEKGSTYKMSRVILTRGDFELIGSTLSKIVIMCL
jgi:hypothetical protein